MPHCHAVLSCPWSHALPCQCTGWERLSTQKCCSCLPLEQSHRPPGSGHNAVCPQHDGEGDTSGDATTPAPPWDTFACMSPRCKKQRGIYTLPGEAKRARP